MLALTCSFNLIAWRLVKRKLPENNHPIGQKRETITGGLQANVQEYEYNSKMASKCIRGNQVNVNIELSERSVEKIKYK